LFANSALIDSFSSYKKSHLQLDQSRIHIALTGHPVKGGYDDEIASRFKLVKADRDFGFLFDKIQCFRIFKDFVRLFVENCDPHISQPPALIIDLGHLIIPQREADRLAPDIKIAYDHRERSCWSETF
jgi:hypothetical protein